MDTDKIRIQNQICKKCWNGISIAGQAFTDTTCKNCGKQMTFPTTDVDMYCQSCALELNVCKHCGAEMD